MRTSLAVASLLIVFNGCANIQLKHSTVNQASTLTNLQYQQVLDNLAMIHDNPSALPWHVNLSTGTAQVTDFGSAAFLMGFGRQQGHLATYSPSLSAQRTIVETWGTVPVTNESNLKLLRMAYRNAYGWGETLSNHSDFADDLGHDLAEQIHISLDESRSPTLFREEQLGRDRTTNVVVLNKESDQEAGEAAGPIDYLLADKAVVTSTDKCLECDLGDQSKPHEIWIETGRPDPPRPVFDKTTKRDEREYWFNHGGAEPELKIRKNDTITWINTDNVKHSVILPATEGSPPRSFSLGPGQASPPIPFTNLTSVDGYAYFSEDDVHGNNKAGTIYVVEEDRCLPETAEVRARRIVYDGKTVDNRPPEEFPNAQYEPLGEPAGKEVKPLPGPVKHELARHATKVNAGDAVAWVNKSAHPIRIIVFDLNTKKWKLFQNVLNNHPTTRISQEYLFPLTGYAYKFFYRIEELVEDVNGQKDGKKTYHIGKVVDGVVRLDYKRRKSPLVKEVCRQLVDINDELESVPIGWFHVGTKHDVPKNACFKGHYGDRYIWVCPEGREALSKFTISVLKLSGSVKERQVVTSPGVQYSPGFALGGSH